MCEVSIVARHVWLTAILILCCLLALQYALALLHVIPSIRYYNLLERLQARIGVRFRNPGLYKLAMTHPSFPP